MIKKINNKIINNIVANLIVKHYDEHIVDFVKTNGFTKNDLSKWLNCIFVNWLFGIYENRPVLEWFLCLLCEIEMGLKIAKDKEFRDYVNTCHICSIDKDGNMTETSAKRDIPKDTLYCCDCPFSDNSNIAKFIFGYQSSGYCYYLGKGDFSYINHTDLLWDGCKECGVNEDIEVDFE